MPGILKTHFAAALLTVEVVAAAAIAISGFVVNVFWVNDGLVDVSTYPWWSTAARTFAEWLIPIGSYGLVAWLLNIQVVAPALGWTSRLTRRVSIALLGLSVSGSALGALFFGYFKPHM